MITISKEEYLNYTGRNLEIELQGLDDESNKVERTISLWTKRVYAQMTPPVLDDDKLTNFQKQCIKDAICEYGEYYLKNGDLYRLSGFDEDKGQLINSKEINKIKFPQVCIDLLRQCGLIRSNLGRGYKVSQNFDNYYF